MSTYRIVDVQSDEIVVINQTLDDLRIFANDLFWNDDVDFVESDFKTVNEAILGCDYLVEKEN